jgi:hypothetical protein
VAKLPAESFCRSRDKPRLTRRRAVPVIQMCSAMCGGGMQVLLNDYARSLRALSSESEWLVIGGCLITSEACNPPPPYPATSSPQTRLIKAANQRPHLPPGDLRGRTSLKKASSVRRALARSRSWLVDQWRVYRAILQKQVVWRNFAGFVRERISGQRKEKMLHGL